MDMQKIVYVPRWNTILRAKSYIDLYDEEAKNPANTVYEFPDEWNYTQVHNAMEILGHLRPIK